MDTNIIRAIILFIIGVVLILFPKRIYQFQSYVIKKLHSKYEVKTDRNYNAYYGIIIMIISILLFGIAIN